MTQIPPLVLPIYPEMKSFEDKLEKEVTGASKEAGEKGGEALGKELAEETNRSFKRRFDPNVVRNIALGAAAAGGALIAAAYQVGKEFDTMSDTIRVGTGATGDDLAALEESARRVGMTSTQSFGEVGAVVADINTRLGLTGSELEAVSSAVLLAQELGQDLDINTVTGAMKVFGIQNEDIADQMDALFRVSQSTGVGMNELATIAQKAAPQLTNLGFSFEEATALIGTMDKAGIDASKMTAGLGKALVTLAKDGEEPQDAFRRVTGEIQALVDSGKTAEAIDLASGLFGRGASTFISAVQSGTLEIDNMYASLDAGTDTLATAASETRDFEEQVQVLGNIASVAFEPFASAVFTAFGDTLTDLMPQITEFSEWLRENTWVIWTFAGIIGGTLVMAMGLWIGTIWASTAALLANPITWIILAIVALIAGIVLLAANWDTVFAGIVGWIQEVIGWIDSAASSVEDWIQDLLVAIGLVEEAGSVTIAGQTAEQTAAQQKAVEDWINGGRVGPMPGLANGGTLTSSGSVLVGERGPEILNLPEGASVIPLDKTGNTYNITNMYPQAEPTSTTVRRANQLAVA